MDSIGGGSGKVGGDAHRWNCRQRPQESVGGRRNEPGQIGPKWKNSAEKNGGTKVAIKSEKKWKSIGNAKGNQGTISFSGKDGKCNGGDLKIFHCRYKYSSEGTKFVRARISPQPAFPDNRVEGKGEVNRRTFGRSDRSSAIVHQRASGWSNRSSERLNHHNCWSPCPRCRSLPVCSSCAKQKLTSATKQPFGWQTNGAWTKVKGPLFLRGDGCGSDLICLMFRYYVLAFCILCFGPAPKLRFPACFVHSFIYLLVVIRVPFPIRVVDHCGPNKS